MGTTAPKWMQDKIRAVDPDLSIVWLAHEGKYAVIQKLDAAPSVESLADMLAHALQDDMRNRGYTVDLETCRQLSYEKAAADAIVLRLEDAEGNPTTLTDDVIAKLRRMAWRRRNWGQREWRLELDEQYEGAQKAREKQTEHIWSSIKKDRTYHRMMSDALWGLKPMRSVMVPDNAPI